MVWACGHGTFGSKAWKEPPDTVSVLLLRSAARLSTHRPFLSKPKAFLVWGSEAELASECV